MSESIITVKRRKGFTVLPNSTLRDNRLSLKTRAILAIMISMPDDWDYTVSGLAIICGAGKDAIRTSLRELEACGYLTREQRHNETGHFDRNAYTVTDEPATGDHAMTPSRGHARLKPASGLDAPIAGSGDDTPLSGYPSTVEPSTDEPLTDNPTEQNKDCTNTPYYPPEGDVQVGVQKHTKREPDWELFDQFWAAYPRKQNKDRARRAWKKLNPDEDLFRTMSAALEQDKRSEQWRRDGGTYIPHPSTWLNGRRWEDEHGAAVSPHAAPPSAPLRGEGVRYL